MLPLNFDVSVSQAGSIYKTSNLSPTVETTLPQEKPTTFPSISKHAANEVDGTIFRQGELHPDVHTGSKENFTLDEEDKNPIKDAAEDEKKTEECETCKNRKYQDGSDENVSFKSPSHISPQSAGSAVRAHENEHVSNAYKKAAQGNGQVLQASVSIHTAVCPECGRSYVAGGTTHTMIRYPNESNPYQQALKNQDATYLQGANVNQLS